MLPAVLSESKEPDLPVIAKKMRVSNSMKVEGKEKIEKKRQKGG